NEMHPVHNDDCPLKQYRKPSAMDGPAHAFRARRMKPQREQRSQSKFLIVQACLDFIRINP
ncbi:MAG: hypothetical protein O2964_16915, partial [Verrucomicrobia bacterium]|nr:hypothetical protein [Verrucomicrobiota bacterium]